MAISIVMNCDCLEYMATCKDKQFSLAIVDPPYGIGVDGKNLVRNNSDRFQDKAKRNHEWDNVIPNEKYFNELFRVSREQIIWGGQLFS